MKELYFWEAVENYSSEVFMLMDEQEWNGYVDNDSVFEKILQYCQDDGIKVIDEMTVDYDDVLSTFRHNDVWGF